MSEYTINGSTLADIASAIRNKTGKSSTMRPVDMPAEIGSISGGGVKFSKTSLFTSDTDVENITVTTTATKFIRDGQLLILHEGILYNVMGQVIE